MSNFLEMAITRALEVVETGMQPCDYRTPADANWLGFGLGVAYARGWVVAKSDSGFGLTPMGEFELRRRLTTGMQRMPRGLVPSTTILRNEKQRRPEAPNRLASGARA